MARWANVFGHLQPVMNTISCFVAVARLRRRRLMVLWTALLLAAAPGASNAQEATSASVTFTFTSGSFTETTFFTFLGSGEVGLDRSDAYNLVPYSNVTRLVAMSYPITASVGDAAALDIHNLPMRPETQLRVPLDVLYLTFSSAYESVARDVQVSWSGNKVTQASLQLGLYDVVEDTTLDLMTNGSYSFTTRARGTIAVSGTIYPVLASHRFEVVVTNLKPSLATPALGGQASRKATLADTIRYDGGSDITAHGTCYSSSGTPALGAGTCTDLGVPGGAIPFAFEDALSGLAPSTSYQARTYAVNATDTTYGATQSFLTGASARTVSVPSFHLFSSPVAGSVLPELLGPLWTQGMANADYTGGQPNVWTWDGAQWDPVLDLATESLEAGQGLLVYVYADTDFDGQSDLPVNVGVTGEEAVLGVSAATVHRLDATTEVGALSGWNLIGNPYSYPIDTDLLELGGAGNGGYDPTVFAYNPATDDWDSWNGSTGTLAGGVIPPYSGFLVRSTSEATTSLSIPNGARLLDGAAKAVFARPAGEPSRSLRLTLEDPALGMSDDAFVSFSANGRLQEDSHDAPKLQPPAVRDRVLAATHSARWGEGEATAVHAYEIQSLPRTATEPMDGEVSVPVTLLWLDTPYDDAEGGAAKSRHPMVAPGEAAQAGSATTLYESEARELVLSWSWEGTDLDSDGAGAGLTAPEDLEVWLVDRHTGERIDLSTPGTAELQGQPGVEVPSGFAFAGLTADRFELLVRYEATSVSTETDPAPSPDRIRLHPNVPNPFNPATTISFTLPDADRASLKVYDPAGRLVGVPMQDRALGRGEHAVQFEAGNLPSGVYLVVLETSSGGRVSRLISLLK